MIDFLVIGAGAAGAFSAYFLKRAGFNVAVADMFGVSEGASKAAGAFISPRLGKGGVLQKITNEAFNFSIDFYKTYFPLLFFQTGVLRLPKDERDALKFLEYISFIDVDFKLLSSKEIDFLTPYANKFGGIFFPKAGIVEAKSVVEAVMRDILFFQTKIENIKKEQDFFLCNDIKAKNVIIATGAWDELLPAYIKIGKLSGYRFDVKSTLELPFCLHKRISISSPINERVIIGATHKRVEDISCVTKPDSFLIDEAKKMLKADFEIVNFLCGVRPSVNDHLPFLGRVVDVEDMLNRFPKAKKGQKITNVSYIDGLYVIGGYGGRGFVFAPFMAKKLVDLAIFDKIDKEINSDRLFFRWVKKG